LKENPIELRVSVFPVYGGERVAIRVQDHCRFDFSLDHLGILGPDQARFRRELQRRAPALKGRLDVELVQPGSLELRWTKF